MLRHYTIRNITDADDISSYDSWADTDSIKFIVPTKFNKYGEAIEFEVFYESAC